ncbi:MAG: hypothetical protein V4471_02680 [Pseudomonadota bacterium]
MDYDTIKKMHDAKKKCRMVHENELTKMRSLLNETRVFLIDDRRVLNQFFVQEMNAIRRRIKAEKQINQTEVMLRKHELLVRETEHQLKHINEEIASLETSLTKFEKNKNAKLFKFFKKEFADKSKRDDFDKSACNSPSFSYSNLGYV